MKAIILTRDGDKPGKLQPAELPLPAIEADEVLIRVHAIDINPVDNKTLQGKGQFDNIKGDDPMILGWGVCEVVAETNEREKSNKEVSDTETLTAPAFGSEENSARSAKDAEAETRVMTRLTVSPMSM